MQPCIHCDVLTSNPHGYCSDVCYIQHVQEMSDLSYEEKVNDMIEQAAACRPD